MSNTTETAPTTVANLRETARPSNLPAVHLGFFDLQGFELLQRVSKAFAVSDLVPKQYQDNVANCMIALDMAQRIGANPLMVMQNLYIVHGTPGWSSKFLIATINTCGRYSTLRYEWRGQPGDSNYGCRAWAIEKSTNERLEGIWVDWKMVNAEGWASKNGSKWKTMPDQMFIYRSAAFWQRAYAPELGMGLQTQEEIIDTIDAVPSTDGTIQVDVDALRRPARQQRAKEDAAVDMETGEVIEQQEQPKNTSRGKAKAEAGKPAQGAAAATPASNEAGQADAPDYDKVAASLRAAKSIDTLDIAADLIREVQHPDDRGDLELLYQQRREELDVPAPEQQPQRTRRAMNVE